MNVRRIQAHALILVATSAAALIVWPPQQGEAQEHRQLEAHQHGHGTLNLAVEGRTLQVELDAPGADIVGFEHPAASDADKAKVAAARKKLADPSQVFAVPAQAGCRLASARVVLEGEEDSADHGKKSEKRAGHGGEAIHSEFRVAYTFDCAGVAAITRLTFSYFRNFPNAEELEVTLITDKGQKTFEVDRATGHIEIGNLM